jgi:exosortase/archaeosortase family protein
MTRRPTIADRFVLRGLAATLGLFGVLRLAWKEAHVVLPATQMQARLAARWFGDASAPVTATLACSGADALALCVGAVLAYPVSWRARVSGAACGTALILLLNTVRIGTLGEAAADARWFAALHLYIWPAVLTLAIAGYVFAWMRYADRGVDRPLLRAVPRPSQRFIILTIAFLLVFLAVSPLYLESARLLALAGIVARAAAVTLASAGIPAHAAANVLWTGSGGFLVTPECIATPLVPVYLAAVCAYAPTWRRLTVGVLATVPIFLGLGIARLLLVALPAAVASPLFWVHAFYQLLAGAVVVVAAACWRHRTTAGRHALGGIVAGIACGVAAAPVLTHVVAAAGATPVDDPQGAIALLPAFQVALYVALWVAASTDRGWTRFTAGFAILAVTLTAGLLGLRVLAAYALTPHVRDIRAWAIAAPVVIFAAAIDHARTRR